MNAEFSLMKLEYKSARHTLFLYLQDFAGNKDQSSVEKHEMQPFRALVLRLYPSAWHQYIALRMELYGKRLRSK